MIEYTLYYATNRGHVGKDRWRPEGYGSGFSHDGHDNLRFGKVIVSVDEQELQRHLYKKIAANPTRIGDGENLNRYLSKQAESAKVYAIEDLTTISDKNIPEHKNASVEMFREIKQVMEQSHDVLVFIHGFNVSWASAVGTALAMEMMLNRVPAKTAHPILMPQQKVRVVLFSWPSDGKIIPWRSYGNDRQEAQLSGEAVGRAMLKLRDFLVRLRLDARKKEERLCYQSLHLLCHSMGNYVLQNTLAKMTGYITKGNLPRIFENVFMCAPDVDEDVLESGKPLFRLPEICQKVFIYCNRRDKALTISDITKANPDRLGHNGPAHPQNLHHKINVVDCSDAVGRFKKRDFVEHNYFLWATASEDIAQTLHDVADDADIRQRKRKADSLNIWQLV
ncbi:alpha/beta hydrolase [Gynuella sp.]|uniref:alpha/beta hydrolase n=1 Tax=Gynuella sp. TaxID=2969146 RepID=UPI003D149BDB